MWVQVELPGGLVLFVNDFSKQATWLIFNNESDMIRSTDEYFLQFFYYTTMSGQICPFHTHCCGL